jgi:hypothetical protein
MSFPVLKWQFTLTVAGCLIMALGWVTPALAQSATSGSYFTFKDYPRAINLFGSVTGLAANAQGFIRKPLGAITIFQVSSASTTPTAINVWGDITGYYSFATPFSGTAGFLRDAHGNITTFTESADVIEPAGINSAGEITGTDQHPFQCTPTGCLFRSTPFVRSPQGTFTRLDQINGTGNSINAVGAITKE